jgi:hypothetical protein
MISSRGIFIIAVVAGGLWLLRRWHRRLAMVRCAHCGVHLPLGKAIGDSQAGYFCSETHRRARDTAQDC